MTDQQTAIADVLIDIEYELRRIRLWQDEPISEEALASEQPFAVDTMDFHQWIQFILLPRMHHLIAADLPLPSACGVTPMAEYVYGEQPEKMAPLIQHLKRLDQLFESQQ